MKQFIKCPECGLPIIATIVETAKDSPIYNVKNLLNFSYHWEHKGCSQGGSMDPDEFEPLKALSIKQPWAWLIIRPDLEGEARLKALNDGIIKNFENRDNLKNFTGTFLVHASIKPDKLNDLDPGIAEGKAFECMIDAGVANVNHELRKIEWEKNPAFKYGGIIGYATISGYDEVDYYGYNTKNYPCKENPWFVGKYGLKLKEPNPLPFTPCKGKLSFFYPEID